MFGDVGVSRLAVTQLSHGLVGSNPTTSTKFWEYDEIGLSYLTFNQAFRVRVPVLLPSLIAV